MGLGDKVFKVFKVFKVAKLDRFLNLYSFYSPYNSYSQSCYNSGLKCQKNVCGRCVVKNAAPTLLVKLQQSTVKLQQSTIPSPPDLKDFKDLISLLIPSRLICSHADVDVVDGIGFGLFGDNDIVDGIDVVGQMHQVVGE